MAVNNLALSGRSSKSFIDPADNANYATFTSSLKAGDYVLIGFGHNDEKADPTLYTNPNGDVTDPTSFKYYLYTYYIKVAQDAGATPILATPVVRRDSSGAYAGAKVHVTTDVVSGGVTYPGGDYPQAIRDLGAALGVMVIDNTASTLALGKQIFAASGATGTAQLQAWVSNLVTSVDDTHTNIYGGAYYAYLVATGLAASTSSLKDHVLPGIVPPDISDPGPQPELDADRLQPADQEHQLDDDRSLDRLGVRRRRRDDARSPAAASPSAKPPPSPLVVSMSSGSPTVSGGKDRRRHRRHRLLFSAGADRQGLRPVGHRDGHLGHLQQQPGRLRADGARRRLDRRLRRLAAQLLRRRGAAQEGTRRPPPGHPSFATPAPRPS